MAVDFRLLFEVEGWKSPVGDLHHSPITPCSGFKVLIIIITRMIMVIDLRWLKLEISINKLLCSINFRMDLKYLGTFNQQRRMVDINII